MFCLTFDQLLDAVSCPREHFANTVYPFMVNEQQVRELAFSGRRFRAVEAQRIGFVSKVLPTHEESLEAGLSLCKQIASKSPVAVLGIKNFLNYSRDHSVQDSLDYALTWNQSAIQTGDMALAAMAKLTREGPPKFDDLPGDKSKL